jgi:hypothetical protein
MPKITIEKEHAHDLEKLKGLLASCAREFCTKLFPNGKCVGKEYVVGSLGVWGDVPRRMVDRVQHLSAEVGCFSCFGGFARGTGGVLARRFGNCHWARRPDSHTTPRPWTLPCCKCRGEGALPDFSSTVSTIRICSMADHLARCSDTAIAPSILIHPHDRGLCSITLLEGFMANCWAISLHAAL